MRWPVIRQPNGCYCQADVFNQTAKEIILYETLHIGTPLEEAEAMLTLADISYPSEWNTVIENLAEQFGREFADRFNQEHSYL